MDKYYYSDIQIERRVLAPCNVERLKEHRQCEFCHLCFDCIVYKDRNKINLCQFLDNFLKEEK